MITDEQLEQKIDAERTAMFKAGTRALAKEHHDRWKRLIALRSPEQIAKMEMAKG